MKGDSLDSRRTTELLLIIYFLGLACFSACVFHVLFASKTYLHHAHMPIQEGYSYGKIIPIAFALILLNFLVAQISKKTLALNSGILWFSNFFLIWVLQLASWPSIGTWSNLMGSLIIGILMLFLFFVDRLGLPSRGKSFKGIAGYASMFLSFLVSTRFVQAIIVNQKFPLDKSFISFAKSDRQYANVCRPSSSSIYAQSQTKSLIIVLDAFPVESLFNKLTGKPSELHQFLRHRSSIYKESYTNVPYTPLSLAYLLAGFETKADCSYPYFDHSRLVRLAFSNSAVFRTGGAICSYRTGSLYLIAKATLARRLGDKIDHSYDRDCSLANKSLVEKILHWVADGMKCHNCINIIHDLRFHDLGKDSSNYLEIDFAYMNSLKLLIKKIIQSDIDYDRIIVMSDHGPRTARFGKLLPGQFIKKDSLKFKDYYSTFYAVFYLRVKEKPSTLLGGANAKILYQIDQYGYPSRVFLSP